MKRFHQRQTGTAALLAVAVALGAGQAAAQTATIAVGAPVTSIDPHYHQLSPNNAVADIIFDRLVNNDAQSRNIPGLALEWRAVEPTVWEFKLRPNVRFHNGNPFTAEDVAFTLSRLPNVPNSPSSFAAYARTMSRVEIVDPLTIRFHTPQPYPLLPLDMTNVRIVDRETVEGATTEDFNSLRVAMGTGPYRAAAHRNGDRIEFERWDGYWGERAPFQRVNYRMVTNADLRPRAAAPGPARADRGAGRAAADLPRARPRARRERELALRHRQRGPAARAQPAGRCARAPRAVHGDRPPRDRGPRDGRGRGAGQPVPSRGRVRPRVRPAGHSLRPGRRAPPAGRGRLPAGLPHPAERAERPLHQRCAHHPGDRPDVDAHRPTSSRP